MSVYLLTGILPSAEVVTRYMRGISAQACRVRAYKALQMRCYGIANIGERMPAEVGSVGYDIAVKTLDIDPIRESHVHARGQAKIDGPIVRDAPRVVSRAQSAKIDREAETALAEMGL